MWKAWIACILAENGSTLPHEAMGWVRGRAERFSRLRGFGTISDSIIQS